jgi:hypothetical protein
MCGSERPLCLSEERSLRGGGSRVKKSIRLTDPAAPCPYLAGSPEKIKLMSKRAAAGVALFVKGDATLCARKSYRRQNSADPGGAWQRYRDKENARQQMKRAEPRAERERRQAELHVGDR